MVRSPVFLYGCCLLLLALLAWAKESNAQLRNAYGRQAEEFGQPIPRGCENAINLDREDNWSLMKMISGVIGSFAVITAIINS
jgi:hypothetical protein